MLLIWSINDDTSILLIFSCKTFSILTDISIDIYIDIDIDISHGQLDIYIFIDIDISHRHIYRYRYIPWTFCTWNRLIIKGTYIKHLIQNKYTYTQVMKQHKVLSIWKTVMTSFVFNRKFTSVYVQIEKCHLGEKINVRYVPILSCNCLPLR